MVKKAQKEPQEDPINIDPHKGGQRFKLPGGKFVSEKEFNAYREQEMAKKKQLEANESAELKTKEEQA